MLRYKLYQVKLLILCIVEAVLNHLYRIIAKTAAKSPRRAMKYGLGQARHRVGLLTFEEIVYGEDNSDATVSIGTYRLVQVSLYSCNGPVLILL